jgi:hypothetical protein
MLAPDIHVVITTRQPMMPETDTISVDKYMDGLKKFAEPVEPGILREIGSVGDERNVLMLVTVHHYRSRIRLIF